MHQTPLLIYLIMWHVVFHSQAVCQLSQWHLMLKVVQAMYILNCFQQLLVILLFSQPCNTLHAINNSLLLIIRVQCLLLWNQQAALSFSTLCCVFTTFSSDTPTWADDPKLCLSNDSISSFTMLSWTMRFWLPPSGKQWHQSICSATISTQMYFFLIAN